MDRLYLPSNVSKIVCDDINWVSNIISFIIDDTVHITLSPAVQGGEITQLKASYFLENHFWW